jgi:hypothetical protein
MRGATLVEYLVVAGFVSLASLGGWNYFSSKVTARTEEFSEKVRTFETANPFGTGTAASAEAEQPASVAAEEPVAEANEGLGPLGTAFSLPPPSAEEIVEDPDSVISDEAVTDQKKKKNYDDVKFAKVAGIPFIHGTGHAHAVHPADVAQGRIGDCYFVASMAAIAATQPQVLRRNLRVKPGNFHPEWLKKGIKITDKFEVDLYDASKGKWVTYKLDDRFPVNKDGKPLYVRTGQVAKKFNLPELWPALYERAFAEQHGGYEAIGHGGTRGAALRALTGQPSTSHTPTKMSIETLDRYVRAKYAVTAGTYSSSSHKLFKDDTLVTQHAYWVESVDVKNQTVSVRNPWGYNRGAIEIKWADFKKVFYDVTTNPVVARGKKK